MNLYPRYGRIAAVVLLLGLGLVSCDSAQRSELASDEADDSRPAVVATSTVIADWVAEVGGDQVALTGILQPGADPHVYEPVPADTIAFEDADLIFYNGYNLEPNLVRLLNAAGVDAQRVAVGEVVPPLDLQKGTTTVPDPHVWGDVSNVVPMVETIRDQLIELAPDQADLFTTNAAAYIAELEQLHSWVEIQTATIPPAQRQLVTTHDAFQYYANAYGLTVAGTLIGLSTEEQPSARTVQQLVAAIQGLGVPAIFAETTINPQLITTVANESGVTLAPQALYSDSIGAPGSDGDSYLKMVVANTRSIVENLGGTVTASPF
ncbi:zinc ABC transporter substrate-binding protein [Leptolyngbya sp. FACHB-60]|uniref:metal ABC transporter solute-binding protein, Zn/Mn family n=1 Tax=unclassified Leptolyngbya TaxID=2650499 RepID=UPI001684D93E|nr:zinc ABC transporter substrate-binding protein [Leptolyngbya sp. FACHB-60]MBD1915981.1 zinc ABC transporter substrate-binding protein [Phormidium sp. FACHB-77]MBD2030345.1 zinc ABC transporter substrate-binding protein [Phormidium sp. FACHB-322]MBD2053347.1 zinc ABC transporter substrate-binding protein [Leptolyngbya sp. FACHB-60]